MKGEKGGIYERGENEGEGKEGGRGASSPQEGRERRSLLLRGGEKGVEGRGGEERVEGSCASPFSNSWIRPCTWTLARRLGIFLVCCRTQSA